MIAPMLQRLSRADWNFVGVGRGLVGKEFRDAEDLAWKQADAELRALLAVVRAAQRGMADWFCGCDEPKCLTCKLDATLARLERVSRVKP